MSIVGVTASSRRKVPNAPTIGTATDVGSSRAFNNGAAVVTFTQSLIGFEATSFTATSSPGGYTATGASSPLTVTGLQSNIAYTFTVTATNFVGTGAASTASNSITATTVPQAPTIGTPTLADGQAFTSAANIGVVFTANATGGKAITTFTATSSSTISISGTTSPITVNDPVGTARTYTVTAANANGTSLASSASAAITPSSVPQAPTINSITNVAGRPVNSPQASVAFNANATGGSTITGFTVTSSSGTTNTGATSPILVTESASGTYTYTVTATNARGTSLASVGVGGSTSSVPNAPTIGTLSNVTGIAFGSNPQFTLTFTAPTSTGGSAITSYKYSTNGGTTYATAPGTTSPMTLTTQSTSGTPAFVAGTNYTVILIAVNANGDSPASAASNSRTAATAPSVPTFTVSSTGITNITNTFSYNNGGLAVTSDSPALSPAISTGFGGVSPVGNTSGALTYTGSFEQGVTYTVPMSITNPIGTATAASKTITPYAAATPGAPATLTAAVASTTSVTLTYGAIATNGSALTAWQGSGTSTGDIVSTPAVTLAYSGTPSAAGSTVTVSGIFAATQSYTFTLKARNGVGLGAGITSNGVVPLPSITDNFNRTGSVLGTTSSGSPWNTLRGTWATNGSVAFSNNEGSTNALASVAFNSSNATVSATVSGGTGVAFWVTDSGSWWAATAFNDETSYAAQGNSGTTSYPAATCSITSTTYSANPTVRPSTTTYSCPGGGTLQPCSVGSSTQCCFTSSTQATGIKSCNETYGTGSVNSAQPCTSCYAVVNGTNQFIGCCEVGTSGAYLGCKGLSYTTTSTSVFATETTTYTNCPESKSPCSGDSTSCCDPVYTYSCVCNSGGTPDTPSGPTSTCSSSYFFYSCPSGGTLSGSQCYSQFYFLRVNYSVGNTVSLVTDINLGSPAAAIKVVTSGNSWTAQAYSNTTLTTALGTAAFGTNTGTKGTAKGIIKTTANYSQGTTVDNFLAT